MRWRGDDDLTSPCRLGYTASMRRKPSPNLPTYKKAILSAQSRGVRFADFYETMTTWDTPYCERRRAYVLWEQTKYKHKYGIEGNGPLQPGHLSQPRPPEQIASIKAALRDGVGFADFWLSAKDWPIRSLQEKARVQSLYKYYQYRLAAHTTKNIEAPKHSSYGAGRRLLAVQSIAHGLKFAEFWTKHGSVWNVPMFRLQTWYRGLQKRWRDLVAVYPEAAKEDLVSAIAARAAVRESRWVAEKLRDGE